ncbi:MAG: RodZ domain-containing protein [Gammaproteobacteria bacterium]
MNPSDTSQESEYMPGTMKPPGGRLQAARIDRGLSIEDIANRMHLSTSIIQSIEDNDFDAITAPIFVKGYLRAFARIVLLNEDEMIAQYTDSFSDADPTINTTSTMAAEITADDARVKWTTFLVILVLIGLLAVWWWNKNQNRADVFSLDALQSDTQAQSGAGDDTMLEEIEAPTEAAAGATSEPVAVGSTDVGAEPPVPAEDGLLATESTPGAAGPEEVASLKIELEQIVKSESAEDSRLISRLAPAGSDRLVIIVNADTWADIKDSGGYQLAYDLLRAGQRVKITGQAPFAVFLGNGHGVELSFNDEEVDLSNRIRDDNTARLKLGP